MANKDPVVIKKYENRRLYDTSSSRYVNLDDVATMIREGTDVKVVDAKTGDDLTRVVLMQVITEDAKDQPTGLPLELLRQLIVASDQARQQFVMWYLKSAFDAYRKVQDAVEGRLSEMRDAALSPLQLMGSLIPGPRPTGQAAPHDKELEELRRRVAELEARLAARRAPRKPAAGSKD